MKTKYDDKDFDYTFKYHDWKTEDFIKEIKYLEWLLTEERRMNAEMEEEIAELNDHCDNLEFRNKSMGKKVIDIMKSETIGDKDKALNLTYQLMILFDKIDGYDDDFMCKLIAALDEGDFQQIEDLAEQEEIEILK